MDTKDNTSIEKTADAPAVPSSENTKAAGTSKTAATPKTSAATPKGTAAKKTAPGKSKTAAPAKGSSAASKNEQPKSEQNASKQKPDSDTQSKTPENSKEGPLYKFFMDALKDIYFAEKHILEALPKMKDAATTEELQEAFEDHHLMTQKQISRLEKVFKSIGEKAEGKKCDAIVGIVKESENIIKETEEGTMTRDAALIIAAQKVEHYEIATYGGLVALAETLELYKAADLLQTTLDEEEQTDRDLTDIAETSINFNASEEDEDEDGDNDEDWDDEEDDDFDEDDDSDDEDDDYNR